VSRRGPDLRRRRVAEPLVGGISRPSDRSSARRKRSSLPATARCAMISHPASRGSVVAHPCPVPPPRARDSDRAGDRRRRPLVPGRAARAV